MARKKAAASPARPRKAKPEPERQPLPGDAILLTLDASSTAIGWSVWVRGRIRAADVIHHPKGWAAGKRMRWNAWAAAALIEQYGVTHVLAESQSHKSAGPRVQGLATLGKAQGYMLAVIEERHPDVVLEEIDERSWTRWGGKNMPKQKRAEIVKQLVPEYANAIMEHADADGGLDVADSIGMALVRLGLIQ